MAEFRKATLQEISSDDPPRTLGEPIDVQFNPSTLRLQLSNQTEGGQSRGKQNRQYMGSSSTTLTLDLIFDTADEGSTNTPRSVREKTGLIEKFVLPRGEGEAKQAPPKVRFQWGNLVLDGLIDSVNIDFEHFAADGTPLRAKVGVSIKEQNSKYQYLAAGEGKNSGKAPAAGKSTPAAPGSTGSGGEQSALALAGESAADFAARMGLDPAAWRGLSGAFGAGVSLQAGVEVEFSASLSVSAGLGVSLGVQAGVSASLEARFGLDVGVSAVAGVGTGAELAAGFNLSAAGGVSSAIESVKTTRSASARSQTEAAFRGPGETRPGQKASVGVSAGASASARGSTSTLAVLQTVSAPATPGLPEQTRTPLRQETPGALEPAPAPPRADPRATSFGYGVPLRTQTGPAANSRSGTIQGRVPLRAQVSSGDPPVTADPTTPLWVALRDQPGTAPKQNGPSTPCVCRPGKQWK